MSSFSSFLVGLLLFIIVRFWSVFSKFGSKNAQVLTSVGPFTMLISSTLGRVIYLAFISVAFYVAFVFLGYFLLTPENFVRLGDWLAAKLGLTDFNFCSGGYIQSTVCGLIGQLPIEQIIDKFLWLCSVFAVVSAILISAKGLLRIFLLSNG